MASVEELLRDTSFTVADAVRTLVKFRSPVAPQAAWREVYRKGLAQFEASLQAG